MATIQKVHLKLNGRETAAEVEPRTLLAHMIRDVLGLTGTHIGCDTSSCGACTVMLDGRPIKSCTLFAVQADGGEIVTIEGMTRDGQLHPLQQSFHEEHGLQCGFCTPGMILSAYALLQRNPSPSEEEIRWGISGNLCRCTGYQNIVAAIHSAAGKMQQRGAAGSD